MNIVFILDPLDTIIPQKDTSFALMISAKKKGHSLFHVQDTDLIFKDGHLEFLVTPVDIDLSMTPPFKQDPLIVMTEKDVDVVFMRQNPPFGLNYLHCTWLLDQLSQTAVVNTPSGVRSVNEKLWALQFQDIVPKTVVSGKINVLTSFLNEEKDIILKPVNAFGGQGIFRVKETDANRNVIFETLTQNESQPVIVQEYLPDAQNGDKRILLLNGDPLGAILRVHGPDDHRNNFFAGGAPQQTNITDTDMAIIDRIKPDLQRLGLYFVGIDIIGGKLIEVNVTSPTCICEMAPYYDEDLPEKVIEFSETLSNAYH
ncbi:MAG: glutathione synthase [Candidatus Margulisbacteria bacterium]|nr:glutathione synthase [Candidatus Margulisiibacteriota bacterium]